MTTIEIVNPSLDDPLHPSQPTNGHLRSWIEAGKPRIWITLQSADGLELQVDYAYGGLRFCKGNEVIATDNDLVQTDDGQYIGMADYYGFPDGKIYKAL